MSINPSFELFKKEFPEVFSSYGELYRSTSEKDLDEKTKQLVYIGILTACGYGPALKVHIEKALKAGATKSEIKAASLLAIPAAGACNFLTILPDLLNELENEDILSK